MKFLKVLVIPQKKGISSIFIHICNCMVVFQSGFAIIFVLQDRKHI